MIPIFLAITIRATSLEVGPGKPFARIEAAVAVASTGDTILVYPDPSGYPGTAVRIQTHSITIRGVGNQPVPVRGTGFDYSGSGSVPRAIIQVEPTGSGAKVENLNLSDAHNQSFNGAGVRIQAANDVTISDCIIHGNDMGIMSNGQDNNPTAGSNQRIEYCLIEGNGNFRDPGFNHNLYLGGTSAYLSHCEIRKSLTGHNLKSRTHYIQVEGCYIHDSANREIDLPEAWDTVRHCSNAVFIGNRIIKDPNCSGNRGVFHFGKEKGSRLGSLYLFSNTIVSPFVSPVVTVSSLGSMVVAEQNIFLNPIQGIATLWDSILKDTEISVKDNLFSLAYGDMAGNTTGNSRTESFGRVAPYYLSIEKGGTGIVPGFKWIDGIGNVKRRNSIRTELSRIVGPRTK
jgi:hypothetical protein